MNIKMFLLPDIDISVGPKDPVSGSNRDSSRAEINDSKSFVELQLCADSLRVKIKNITTQIFFCSHEAFLFPWGCLLNISAPQPMIHRRCRPCSRIITQPHNCGDGLYWILIGLNYLNANLWEISCSHLGWKLLTHRTHFRLFRDHL